MLPRKRERRDQHLTQLRKRVLPLPQAGEGRGGGASADAMRDVTAVNPLFFEFLDDLPRPHAGAGGAVLACPVGALRIGWRRPPKAAGLRRVLGGRDQMGDEIGP